MPKSNGRTTIYTNLIMAVVGTNLTSNTGAANNSIATASISPVANSLILVGFLTTHNNGSPGVPSVTGNGITYALVDSRAFDSDRTLFLFRGMSSSPSAGAVTITLDRSSLEVNVTVDQFTNVKTSGTNGADAVVQSVDTISAGTTTSVTATLAAFADVNNATYGLAGRNGSGQSVGSGFTLLANPASSRSALSMWKATNDTTVDVTYSSTSVLNAIIGVEIAASLGIRSQGLIL